MIDAAEDFDDELPTLERDPRPFRRCNRCQIAFDLLVEIEGGQLCVHCYEESACNP